MFKTHEPAKNPSKPPNSNKAAYDDALLPNTSNLINLIYPKNHKNGQRPKTTSKAPRKRSGPLGKASAEKRAQKVLLDSRQKIDSRYSVSPLKNTQNPNPKKNPIFSKKKRNRHTKSKSRSIDKVNRLNISPKFVERLSKHIELAEKIAGLKQKLTTFTQSRSIPQGLYYVSSMLEALKSPNNREEGPLKRYYDHFVQMVDSIKYISILKRREGSGLLAQWKSKLVDLKEVKFGGKGSLKFKGVLGVSGKDGGCEEADEGGRGGDGSTGAFEQAGVMGDGAGKVGRRKTLILDLDETLIHSNYSSEHAKGSGLESVQIEFLLQKTGVKTKVSF